MDLNEIQQRELDSLRDANNELRNKVKELEAKIEELENDKSP
jgi:phage shock protein A